jgi:hypothetical protein
VDIIKRERFLGMIIPKNSAGSDFRRWPTAEVIMSSPRAASRMHRRDGAELSAPRNC